MHTYKDLGSIKSSTNKTSESIKSEFTCCSISFARALVIGPILISLGLFTIGSSVYVGGATVVGMSSSGEGWLKQHKIGGNPLGEHHIHGSKPTKSHKNQQVTRSWVWLVL